MFIKIIKHDPTSEALSLFKFGHFACLDVSESFCERELRRFSEKELIPLCFFMKRERERERRMRRRRRRRRRREREEKEKENQFLIQLGGLFEGRKMFGATIVIAIVLSSSKKLL